MKNLRIFAAVIVFFGFTVTKHLVFGAIPPYYRRVAGNSGSTVTFMLIQDPEEGPWSRQDPDNAAMEVTLTPPAPPGGPPGETQEHPIIIPGIDGFAYGVNALFQALQVFILLIGKKVGVTLLTLHEFLKLFHAKVHVNGTNYHETAYITMRV